MNHLIYLTTVTTTNVNGPTTSYDVIAHVIIKGLFSSTVSFTLESASRPSIGVDRVGV